MWIALLLATLARVVSPAEIAKDPLILRTCWELVVNAHYGFSHAEEAAFVVRGANGHFAVVKWGTSDAPDSARWIGAFPNGTVAIVHTHPNWMPSPSRVDVRTAVLTHVPVYVLTRSRISKTDGARIEIVAVGEWKPRT